MVPTETKTRVASRPLSIIDSMPDDVLRTQAIERIHQLRRARPDAVSTTESER